MHYQLSDALTREVYVQVSRKVLACVRHECYNQVQEILKREGRSQITNEELDEILDKIGEKYQEGYRVGAMKLYGVEVPEGEVPKRYLQKAYLKFSTISTVESEPGKPATRPKWNSLVQHEQKVHGEQLEKIRLGERIEGIEKNPLDSAETDIVVDYSMVPGFLQREKSKISGEDKLRIQPHAGSISAVNKILKRAREVKANHESEHKSSDVVAETHEEHKDEDEPEIVDESKEEKKEPVEENAPLIQEVEPVVVVEEKK